MAKKSLEEKMEAMHTPGAAQSRKLGLPTMRDVMAKVAAAQKKDVTPLKPDTALEKKDAESKAASEAESKKTKSKTASEMAAGNSETAVGSKSAADHKEAQKQHLFAKKYAEDAGDKVMVDHHEKMADLHGRAVIQDIDARNELTSRVKTGSHKEPLPVSSSGMGKAKTSPAETFHYGNQVLFRQHQDHAAAGEMTARNYAHQIKTAVPLNTDPDTEYAKRNSRASELHTAAERKYKDAADFGRKVGAPQSDISVLEQKASEQRNMAGVHSEKAAGHAAAAGGKQAPKPEASGGEEGEHKASTRAANALSKHLKGGGEGSHEDAAGAHAKAAAHHRARAAALRGQGLNLKSNPHLASAAVHERHAEHHRQQHVLQKGKKGGTFYIGEGGQKHYVGHK